MEGGGEAAGRPTTRQAYVRLFRDQVRAYLARERAFEFVAEDAPEDGVGEASPSAGSEGSEGSEGTMAVWSEGRWVRVRVGAGGWVPLCVGAVGASSQDGEDQGPAQLLREDDSFWSSVGRGDPDAQEALVFALAGPLCTVTCVEVQVYRARFQFGEPIYPCAEVGIEVLASLPREAKALGIFDGAGILGPPLDAGAVDGAGAGADAGAGPPPRPRPPHVQWFRVARHAGVQRFALPGWARRTGGYVVVRLRGFLQRQLEDNLLYMALRTAGAHGTRCPPHLVPRVARHVRLGCQGDAPAAGAGLWLGGEGSGAGIAPGAMACLLGGAWSDTREAEHGRGAAIGRRKDEAVDAGSKSRSESKGEAEEEAEGEAEEEEEEEEEEVHLHWSGWALHKTRQRWTFSASGEQLLIHE